MQAKTKALFKSHAPHLNYFCIPTIIFFEKNYVFIILKINNFVKIFFANQFILSLHGYLQNMRVQRIILSKLTSLRLCQSQT